MTCRYTSRDSESGYALLMVVFFAAVMLITVAVAGPNLLTQGKREKEDELIWRGGQYTRAVRFYYRKNGRFPHSLEDLTKAQNDIHFLRKPYKDPMNSEDGSWRLIYVGPGGQLIGSVKRKSLLQPTGIQAALGLAGPGAAPTGSGQPAPERRVLQVRREHRASRLRIHLGRNNPANQLLPPQPTRGRRGRSSAGTSSAWPARSSDTQSRFMTAESRMRSGSFCGIRPKSKAPPPNR